MKLVSRLWRRMVRNSPRQLRFTRAGRVVVGLALAVGFAAINTGNNLLFLAWGLILSGIVVSGVLSEIVLRTLTVDALLPRDARAMAPVILSTKLSNSARRFAALGLDVRATMIGPTGASSTAQAPFVLRLSAGTSFEALARATLTERGKHVIDQITVETMYPFGFFIKARPFKRTPSPAFWVAPPAVDVSELGVTLASRRGQSPANRTGGGEDFFAMRTFRDGDDPKRIKWRRSARVGRLMVAENEAMAGREVLVQLCIGRRASHDNVEKAIATAGSVAELLLARGTPVALRGPGTIIGSSSARDHAWTILRALAAMDPQLPFPGGVIGREVMVIAICADDANATADYTIHVGAAGSRVA
ncbi:MAG: DUF58 domain-containing protein [Clostridia bacterium]|nr:DUF58 domain-containing protein [Deltaproteobacteria bacterium]